MRDLVSDNITGTGKVKVFEKRVLKTFYVRIQDKYIDV